MKFEDYYQKLPIKKNISNVKQIILKRLWGNDSDLFPKPWVSSEELLSLTKQKYFDRRTRELRDSLGCALESAYREEFKGHAWRFKSAQLTPPQDREYLSKPQKDRLFSNSGYTCATCGIRVDAGIRGLQADHKIPLSRGGSNALENWQPMCNKSWEEVLFALKQQDPDTKKTRATMFYQFARIPDGSIILTPSIRERESVHFFKTTGGYRFDPDNRETPHSLQADFLKTINKSRLPGKVGVSLNGARKQVSQIDHFDVLDWFIKNDFKNTRRGFQVDEDIRAKAIRTLTKLLDSPREDIRLGAARAALEFKL